MTSTTSGGSWSRTSSESRFGHGFKRQDEGEKRACSPWLQRRTRGSRRSCGCGGIDDELLRVQRRLGEEDDGLGAPGFDCLHTAMKTTTARVLDKVAAAEEEGGHGSPRWCSGVLRGGAEIAKRRGGGGPGRGGMDAVAFWASPGVEMWPRGSRRWPGVAGMLATAAAAWLARGRRRPCPWARLPR